MVAERHLSQLIAVMVTRPFTQLMQKGKEFLRFFQSPKCLKSAAIDAKELAIIARYSKGRAAAEKFYAMANPNNVIALVEALEKAQKRISQLESRAVKLPQRHSMLLREGFNEDYHTEMAFKADEVQASLAAAGIKVEAQ